MGLRELAKQQDERRERRRMGRGRKHERKT